MFLDLILIFAGRLLRAFAFGFSAVLLALHLTRLGLGPVPIGLTIGIGLAAASLGGLGLAWLAARTGRRVALAVTGAGMAISGLLLLGYGPWWLPVISGATGMLGAGAIDLGPFAGIEQAMLTESVPPEQRNRAFGRYSLSGALAGAGGALLASVGTDLTRDRWLFLLFIGLGLVLAALPLLMSQAVEVAVRGPAFGNVKPLLGLAGLFMLDSFGGGLTVNSVIAYWLHLRFGIGAAQLGPAFFVIALIQAGSYEVAGRLADRIGLVRTMVFTHLPSNLLLVLVPFAPSLPVALLLLFLRFSVSQMDVPARQAYVVSIVPPAERAGAVAFTGAMRGVAQALGPPISGLAFKLAALGIPFYVGGGVKIAYDVLLYRLFVRRPAEHELGA